MENTETHIADFPTAILSGDKLLKRTLTIEPRHEKTAQSDQRLCCSLPR